MSEQQLQNSNPLNANLVAFILIISFIVTTGLIGANMQLPSPQVDGADHVEVALVALTETPQPSNTPLPPTLSSNTPILSPTPISTQQTTADTGHSMQGHTAADYDPALAARGEPLFALCAACHGADALGLPKLGKNLVESEFLHSLTDEELVTFIKTGRPSWDALNTTGIDMPPKGGNPTLSDDDIMAIIAYIHSLVPPTREQAVTQPITNTALSYDPAVVAQGQQSFMLCAACHGADALGLPKLGKNLVDSEFVAGLNDEELLAFVKTGRPSWDALNTTGIDMPPKGGNPAMTDEQIRAIIAYIRSLSAGGG